MTCFSPLLHAQTPDRACLLSYLLSAVFHRRAGIVSCERNAAIQNRGLLTCVSSHPQVGTKTLLLKTPTSPLEARAPNNLQMRRLSLFSWRSGEAVPTRRATATEATSHLPQLTGSETQDPSTASLGRDTHHESTAPQHGTAALEKIPQLGSPDSKTALMINTEV